MVSKKICNYLKYVWEFVKYYTLLPVALWKYRGRAIYLLAERGTDARDNAYHLYRYIREKHPDIEAYYIIDRKSADYPKVARYGNVVSKGTLRHYLLFIAARYKISTHIAGYSPFLHFYFKFSKIMFWYGKRIFLQHGIIKDNLETLYKENANVDLFICGARPEYEYVSKNFHYEDQVKYTGLARYDALHDIESKRQILVMPTWRLYLENCEELELACSEYVVRWNRLLQNQRLSHTLKRMGYRLVFYPHYEMQKNIHLFLGADETIVIADFEHYDVQQLLKESQLLVTDYSSVFFDFAYMQKPCVYYQFDAEQFYSMHYKTGYFDFESMGFGEVVQDGNALIEKLINYIEGGCKWDEKYAKRAESFFELHDKCNCERIFKEIQKLGS